MNTKPTIKISEEARVALINLRDANAPTIAEVVDRLLGIKRKRSTKERKEVKRG